MPISRRTAIGIVAGSALGLGSVLATGAFDSLSIDRSIVVEAGGDSGAYLALRPHRDRDGASGGPSVDVDSEGMLQLDFTEPHLNREGVTSFHDLFTMTNNGSKSVQVDATVLDGEGHPVDGITAYIGDDPSDGFPDELDAGGTLAVGMRFDTTGEDAVDTAETLRIEAESTTDQQ